MHFVGLIVLLFFCEKVISAPSITSIIPTSVNEGDNVEIKGNNLLGDANSTIVGLSFGNDVRFTIEPITWTETNVILNVPNNAKSGYLKISYQDNNQNMQMAISPQILLITKRYEKWKIQNNVLNENSPRNGQSSPAIWEYFSGKDKKPELSLRLINSLYNTPNTLPEISFEKNIKNNDIGFVVEETDNLFSSTWVQGGFSYKKENLDNTNMRVVLTKAAASTNPRAFWRIRATTNSENLSIDQKINQTLSPKIYRAWGRAENYFQKNLSLVPIGKPNSIDGKTGMINQYSDASFWDSKYDLIIDHIPLLWQSASTSFPYSALATNMSSAAVDAANEIKNKELLGNPNQIRLAEIQWLEKPLTDLPGNSNWWIYDSTGQRVSDWNFANTANFQIDFSRSDIRSIIVAQAYYATHVLNYDGIFLDCWDENGIWWRDRTPTYSTVPFIMTINPLLNRPQAQIEAQKSLLQEIRNSIGTNKVIIANINYGKFDNSIFQSAFLLDGVWIEAFAPEPSNFGGYPNYPQNPYISETNSFYNPNTKTFTNSATNLWGNIESIISWTEHKTNSLSTRFNKKLNCIYINSTKSSTNSFDLKNMRAGLALSLTCSDGYFLFGKPSWWGQVDGTGNSYNTEHTWYYHWDKTLGKAIESKKDPLNNSQKTSGYFKRKFENGFTIYHPSTNVINLTFPYPVFSVDKQQLVNSVSIGPGPDGDIFLLNVPGNQ